MAKQNVEERSQESGVRSQNPEFRKQKTDDCGAGADLAAENAALKARLAEMESAKSRLDADEILIAAKMAKGLRREQARAVINRQREFEARKQQQIKN
jgi:hypothetical protein